MASVEVRSNDSLAPDQMNSPFRNRLQQITQTTDDWTVMIALGPEHPHSIREVHPAATGRYNCFAFALGLHQSTKYLAVAAHSPTAFANSAFVLHLIREGLVRPTDCTSSGEKLILYLFDGTPKHAGLLTGRRVTSKWGDGKFFEHEVYEVPVSYGSEIQCYVLPPRSQIESEFLSYAARQSAS